MAKDGTNNDRNCRHIERHEHFDDDTLQHLVVPAVHIFHSDDGMDWISPNSDDVDDDDIGVDEDDVDDNRRLERRPSLVDAYLFTLIFYSYYLCFYFDKYNFRNYVISEE